MTNPVAISTLRAQIEASRASLVAQWLRIYLPMQGHGFEPWSGKTPTCHGATKPVSHNY